MNGSDHWTVVVVQDRGSDRDYSDDSSQRIRFLHILHCVDCVFVRSPVSSRSVPGIVSNEWHTVHTVRTVLTVDDRSIPARMGTRTTTREG